MKHILFIAALFTILSGTTTSHAQDTASIAKGAKRPFNMETASYSQDTASTAKGGTSLTIGSRGVKLTRLHRHENWSHTNPSWAANNSYYAMTRIDSNDYMYKIPDLRHFYGVGKDTMIKFIAIVFKDSLGHQQTKDIFIPVTHKDVVTSNAPSYITTVPAIIADSTESVIIHFHPYQYVGLGSDSFKDYSRTMFIYTGIVPDPLNGKGHNTADDKDMEEGDFESHWGILDLGINMISDNTNYNSTAVKNFLNVPANRQNSELFKLRQGKSINVNIYPWMQTLYALKRKNQKINISTGIGLQLYNFRYENPITYNKTGSLTLDNSSFKKDKLGFDYLNIPLMITFKTRIHKDKWLVYGAGITGGYSISTCTKQEANGQKEKVHDSFSFASFNSCLTGEIGISTGIRFYFSYQLTNMFDNTSGMNQHPISFGIRFFAI